MAADSYDRVFLRHVATNIADRATLYRAARRVLKPGGKFGTYDLVAGTGELRFPLPWARKPEDSHLLTTQQALEALMAAGFEVDFLHNDSDAATQWFAEMQTVARPPGPNLALALGQGFSGMTGNIARNLREGRLGGVLMVVATG
ncbi:MAG: methyltransferase domain-containing protein [Pseudomonadota bacterium]